MPSYFSERLVPDVKNLEYTNDPEQTSKLLDPPLPPIDCS